MRVDYTLPSPNRESCRSFLPPWRLAVSSRTSSADRSPKSP